MNDLNMYVHEYFGVKIYCFRSVLVENFYVDSFSKGQKTKVY